MHRTDQRIPEVNEALSHLGGYLLQTAVSCLLLDDGQLVSEARRFLSQARDAVRGVRSEPDVVSRLAPIIDELLFLAATDERTIEMFLDFHRDAYASLKPFWEPIRSAAISAPPRQEAAILSARQAGKDLATNLNRFVDEQYSQVEVSLARLKAAADKFFIERRRAAAVAPVKNVTAFLSHTTADKDLAVAICRELNAAGVRTWRDDKDIRGGDSIPEEIAKGLDAASHFLLLYTPNAKSRPWVSTEINNAIMRQHGPKGLRIIPLLTGGLMPPGLLADRKGIPFDNYESGIEALWQSLGVHAHARVTVQETFRFLRQARAILKPASWCGQADSFLSIDDDTFDELSDLEGWLSERPAPPEHVLRQRFIRNRIVQQWSKETGDEVLLCFDEDFYTFARGHHAGAYLLIRLRWQADRMRTLIEGERP